MPEAETAVIRDGRATLRLDVGRGVFDVVLDDRDTGVTRVALPYPRQGYGGHEMIVSPLERYLAMFMYSGQSENGYELFALEPELRHLGGLPYVYGMGNPPVFSADEHWLALASAVNTSLAPDRADADGLVVWAEVRVQALPAGPITLCQVRVRLGENAAEQPDSCYPEQLRVMQGSVRFTAPWGVGIGLPLPLPDAIEIAGPRD